jgi:hypothetical protein
MLIGYGDNNTLLIGLIESDLDTLHEGLTKTFEGTRMLVKDIVVVWSKDKESLITLLKKGGVSVSEEMSDKYRRGERTDKPHKSN